MERSVPIEVPESFRRMPRWWTEGTAWLDELPRRVGDQCERWGLVTTGEIWHGSNSLVVAVRRGAESMVLRMLPPGDDLAGQAVALRFWNGRGTVRLIDADPEAGAMLLERLGPTSLQSRPLEEAVHVIAGLMRRLALTAPPEATATSSVAAEDAATFEHRWERLAGPVPRRMLDQVLDDVAPLSTNLTPTLAVNGDLHYEQVLAGEREPWLVVDPVLLRGEIEYDLGRVLWSRLDEMPDDAAIRRQVATVVDVAGLDAERARRWIVLRSMSYLLWGLEGGLTEDPPRCRRLLELFAGSRSV